MPIYYDSNVVVLISFVLFFAILGYYGVHKLVFKALDDRAARIRSELDEARRLREEAQATFAEFERRQKDVATQADDIVARAREEAEIAAEKAREDLKVSVARRLKAAEDQIAMAEANAVRELREKAISIAVAAAGDVISNRIGDDQANSLIDGSIEKLETRLH